MMAKNTNQILHRKLKIKQHELPLKPGINFGAPEGLSVPAPVVAPIMLLYNDTCVSSDMEIVLDTK